MTHPPLALSNDPLRPSSVRLEFCAIATHVHATNTVHARPAFGGPLRPSSVRLEPRDCQVPCGLDSQVASVRAALLDVAPCIKVETLHKLDPDASVRASFSRASRLEQEHPGASRGEKSGAAGTN